MAVCLYKHQLEAIDKLGTGSILWGGVGSGKSRTALVYYVLNEGLGTLRINGEGKYSPMKRDVPLYIITTAKKRDTLEWEAEMVPLLLNSKKIVIDSWNLIKNYINVKDAFFIFDEQRLVGSGTWVKSFLKIAKHNNWILLTATPGDTWMDYVPVFIANGYFKNRTEFIRNHVIYNRFTRYPQVERYYGERKLESIRQKILVGMDYKKKTIPWHNDILVDYDLEKYKTVAVDRWNIYEDEPIKEGGQLCYVLRRIVNSDPSRIQKLLELTEKHERMIVFYNFNYELELLRELCEQKYIRYAEWNGHKHQPIPDTTRWVYLVQYAAGAEGWNCISTNVVVFFSQNYSYKAMVQAAGRVDRINSPYIDLYYYHFRTKSSIDMGIKKFLKTKKNFNERAFIRNLDSQQKQTL